MVVQLLVKQFICILAQPNNSPTLLILIPLLDNEASRANVLLVHCRTSINDWKICLVPDLGSGQSPLGISKCEGVVVPGVDGAERPGDRRVHAVGGRNIRESIGGGYRYVAVGRGGHLVGGDVEIESEDQILLAGSLNTSRPHGCCPHLSGALLFFCNRCANP